MEETFRIIESNSKSNLGKENSPNMNILINFFHFFIKQLLKAYFMQYTAYIIVTEGLLILYMLNPLNMILLEVWGNYYK